MQALSKKVGRRGAATRERILRSAERCFAERGFADTRLEDVAAELGITRAALVYYFTSKRSLYDCVLERLFGELVERVHTAASALEAPDQQLEAMIDAWISYAAERPALVRVYLREVANASPTMEPGITRYMEPLFGILTSTLAAGEKRGVFRSVDPMHLLSTFVGATVLFIGVLPALGLDPSFDPLQRDRLDAHRRDVLSNIRRLLGVRKPRLARHRHGQRS